MTNTILNKIKESNKRLGITNVCIHNTTNPTYKRVFANRVEALRDHFPIAPSHLNMYQHKMFLATILLLR